MDDLNGLDWNTSSNKAASKVPVPGTGNYYASFQSTFAPALSGRSTPLSAQASGAFKPPTAGIPKPATPDSFSNLVSFSSAKQGNKLTLQEQQEKLEAEKAKRAAEQRKQYDSQFGHSQFWDRLSAKPQTLGSTPLATSRSSSPPANFASIQETDSFGASNGHMNRSKDEDDDLFAAFSADAKVDSSSYYPPPKVSDTSKNLPMTHKSPSPAKGTIAASLGDDDDPFGLRQMKSSNGTSQDPTPALDDDDFLGDLGKPVEEVRHRVKSSPPPVDRLSPEEAEPDSDDPWDKAVNELRDMGFSAENSRRALTESGAGLDVQAAVGWLLNDAHRQAKEKAQGGRGSNKEFERGSNLDNRSAPIDRSGNEAIPNWMRQDARSQSQPRRDDSRSPSNSDKDMSKTAAAVGSNLLKTANSLWKTSQKKVQKAVSEFSQDSDPTQPKWMRDGSTERPQPKEKPTFPEITRRDREGNSSPDVTDEALMLEAGSGPPQRRAKGSTDQSFLASGSSSSRDQSPVVSNPSTGRSTPVPRWQVGTSSAASDLRSRLSKQSVEEQSAQAYVSPARRKKAVPPPHPSNTSDLVFHDTGAPLPSSERLDPKRPQKQTPKEAPILPKPVVSIPIRPKAPTRNIPALSPAALATSTQHRQVGTAHFKRGDYASAHTSYSMSLSSIPHGHPITIVLLSNRSLTSLKTGDPKGAVSDANTALDLIGPSRGENESIDLGDGSVEAKKPMQNYWGKALTRKAEALEQMERWSDAGAVWKEAVEAGVGGAIAVQGRQRCEKALAPKPKPSTTRNNSKPFPKPTSNITDLSDSGAMNTAAVNRLRAANLAAEKADDEKFALSDSVDARVSKWRDGRKDNLRALLGGLDQVLWEGSGWKKVGMHELVINSKVKIVYMKAIARVHPDKLPQDASTEIKMISASVFATLNEAWDKFKTENGL